MYASQGPKYVPELNLSWLGDLSYENQSTD